MRARTPTSARGSSAAGARLPQSAPQRRQRSGHGFTLIELLVVLVVVALASAVVALAMRDPAATRLEEEGARLSALLETARAEARTLGLPVRFEAGSPVAGEAYRFIGLPAADQLSHRLLDPRTQVQIPDASAVVLGPEPLIGPQRIVLRLDDHALTLATDGLGPFTAEVAQP